MRITKQKREKMVKILAAVICGSMILAVAVPLISGI